MLDAEERPLRVCDAGGFVTRAAGGVHGMFTGLWFDGHMNENPPAAGDVMRQVPWETLAPGQEVTVREAGSQAVHGVVDSLTTDASVVWVHIDGHAPRRMYLAGDPVEIVPDGI